MLYCIVVYRTALYCIASVLSWAEVASRMCMVRMRENAQIKAYLPAETDGGRHKPPCCMMSCMLLEPNRAETETDDHLQAGTPSPGLPSWRCQRPTNIRTGRRPSQADGHKRCSSIRRSRASRWGRPCGASSTDPRPCRRSCSSVGRGSCAGSVGSSGRNIRRSSSRPSSASGR